MASTLGPGLAHSQRSALSASQVSVCTRVSPAGHHRHGCQARPGQGSPRQSRVQVPLPRAPGPTPAIGEGTYFPPGQAGSQKPPPMKHTSTQRLGGLGNLLQGPGITARGPATPGLTVDERGLWGPRREGGEGSAVLPGDNAGAKPLLGDGAGIPCRSWENTEEGTKERARWLGGNQGHQGDRLASRGRGGFCVQGLLLQPQFPNPWLQAGVVWGKEGRAGRALASSEAVSQSVQEALCEHEQPVPRTDQHTRRASSRG